MRKEARIRIDRRAALRKGALLIAGAIAAPTLAALSACAVSEPRPIAYGHDECAFCRMIVTDSRFAGALVTAKGRTLAFDSVECLASYCTQESGAHGRNAAQSIWVSDYEHPGHLIPARRARFIRMDGPDNIMGKGLAAFRSDADAHHVASGSATSGWDEVLALVARDGLRRGIAGNLAPAVPAKLR